MKTIRNEVWQDGELVSHETVQMPDEPDTIDPLKVLSAMNTALKALPDNEAAAAIVAAISPKIADYDKAELAATLDALADGG